MIAQALWVLDLWGASVKKSMFKGGRRPEPEEAFEKIRTLFPRRIPVPEETLGAGLAVRDKDGNVIFGVLDRSEVESAFAKLQK